MHPFFNTNHFKSNIMGNDKKQDNGSRRWFFSRFLSSKQSSSSGAGSGEKVKMLTAEGKLVEVDKNILLQATKNKKASNREIFKWMKNPSKENS